MFFQAPIFWLTLAKPCNAIHTEHALYRSDVIFSRGESKHTTGEQAFKETHFVTFLKVRKTIVFRLDQLHS